MVKMLFVFFVFTCLYFVWDSIKDVRKKSKIEEDLTDARTESEILDMEEEAMALEKENRERKEALYSKDEVTPETEA
jgi:F0F1-type ATP synthase membrane subunit b/b'